MQKTAVKKIGILTSGGDAPGMNACIRSVVRKALNENIECVGIMEGYSGLINDQIIPLDSHSVSNKINEGGSFLYSSRCPEFKTEQGMNQAVKICRKHGIDAVVAIGGDGTFAGAEQLAKHGILTIGLPGTIDNDIVCTDYTIGFDTACNTTVSMINCLRDTCETHARISVVEAMGRHCGLLTLHAALASGAAIVVVPELKYDCDEIIKKAVAIRATGKRGIIIVVCEGCMTEDKESVAEILCRRIKAETEIYASFERFSHVVRGGRPTVRDNITASMMGSKAVELLMHGNSSVVVCEKDGEILPVEIHFALATQRMYKNELTEEDRKDFTEDRIEMMEHICERRHHLIRKLYKLSRDICNLHLTDLK